VVRLTLQIPENDMSRMMPARLSIGDEIERETLIDEERVDQCR
jgi:hypothetical protein